MSYFDNYYILLSIQNLILFFYLKARNVTAARCQMSEKMVRDIIKEKLFYDDENLMSGPDRYFRNSIYDGLSIEQRDQLRKSVCKFYLFIF